MLDFITSIAVQSGKITKKYFETKTEIFLKSDKSPVTIADREAEKLIRKAIYSKFPDHGIIGEEFGITNPKAKYVWVIDPIDGTRDYIRGIPFWNTFIALLENNQPIVSIIYSPLSHELFSAERKKGAYFNGKKIHVSNVSKISDASISHSSIKNIKNKNNLSKIIKLSHSSASSRSFSSYGFNLLLKGKIDCVATFLGEIYDYAAPALIVEEAGGKFTDINGKSSLTSGTGIFTNGHLHSQVLNILK